MVTVGVPKFKIQGNYCSDFSNKNKITSDFLNKNQGKIILLKK